MGEGGVLDFASLAGARVVDLSLTLSERNLGELPVRGAYFIFMPVKIAGSSGGPGRAVALLPE
jgi:hypothetical protein